MAEVDEVTVHGKNDQEKRAFAWNYRTRQWRTAAREEVERSNQARTGKHGAGGPLIKEGPIWRLRHSKMEDRLMTFQFEREALPQLPEAGRIEDPSAIKTVRFPSPFKYDSTAERDSFYMEFPETGLMVFPAWGLPARALWFEERD